MKVTNCPAWTAACPPTPGDVYGSYSAWTAHTTANGYPWASSGILLAEVRDPDELGVQIQRQLLDVTRRHVRGVELGWRREDVALGRLPDDLRDRVADVGRRPVDERIPVRIVIRPRPPPWEPQSERAAARQCRSARIA